MRLKLIPSPSDYVALTPYRDGDFPTFRKIFEEMQHDSPLRHFAQNPKAAETAMVIENRSEKEITALRYRWTFVDAEGKARKKTTASDSYKVDVYRPVISSESRILVTQIGSVNETLIDHLVAGGGFIATGSTLYRDDQAVEVEFQIEFVMFADGEIAGTDPDHYGAELQFRKRAAMYVAQQIRAANTDGRDPTPVLTALRDIPHFRDDLPARLVADYARKYLIFQMGSPDMKEGPLRHLENRSELPKFYRRGTPE